MASTPAPAPNSLWLSTAGPAPETKPLAGDVAADVAIVGAGFTGLRAALALAEAGLRVVVLEAREIGWGASGRNGGQVNPLATAHGPETVARLIGSAYFDRFVEAVLGSADELFALISKHGIDCQARQAGWLRVDHCIDARSSARAIAEGWNRFGAGIEFLDGADLFHEMGSTLFETGTLMRKGGAIQPLAYVRKLGQCTISSGASVYSGTPALGLERSLNKWVVRTPNGHVTSDWVLLCTNGYTDGLWPRLAHSILPLVSIQAATEPLPSSVADEILPNGRTFADTRRVIHYGRREPDGRLVIGSGGRLTADGGIIGFEKLQREAVRIFPALRDARWEFKWGGRIALTKDRVPHLHEPAPGVLAGLGYSGRGIAASNVMGRVLAERVLGKSQAELPFPTSPIRTYALHRFHGIGARAYRWWMGMRDRYDMARR